MTVFATYDFPLRPLRVPEGWRVNYNDFCEVPFDHPQAWRYAFKDSLLMLAHERRGVLVDLHAHHGRARVGWVPNSKIAICARLHKHLPWRGWRAAHGPSWPVKSRGEAWGSRRRHGVS